MQLRRFTCVWHENLLTAMLRSINFYNLRNEHKENRTRKNHDITQPGASLNFMLLKFSFSQKKEKIILKYKFSFHLQYHEFLMA
jgi:hypothetical protein